VYCATSADRLAQPTVNNHYVWLADAWLHGRLDLGPDAPGANDWACFDTLQRGPCPAGRYAFRGEDGERYRWHVAFPPLPAVLILPVVAVFGLGTLDALFWAIFAGLGPALMFLALRFLRESGKSARSVRDDLLVTALFGVGSVYYFVSVQGTVWFAAHVVATAFIWLYLDFSFGARRPFGAGAALGLAFLCRPATLLLARFSSWRRSRRRGASIALRWRARSDVSRFRLRSSLAWRCGTTRPDLLIHSSSVTASFRYAGVRASRPGACSTFTTYRET
jgi:hypothetical protein